MSAWLFEVGKLLADDPTATSIKLQPSTETHMSKIADATNRPAGDRINAIMDERYAETRAGESARQDKARSARPRAKVRKRSASMGGR